MIHGKLLRFFVFRNCYSKQIRCVNRTIKVPMVHQYRRNLITPQFYSHKLISNHPLFQSRRLISNDNSLGDEYSFIEDSKPTPAPQRASFDFNKFNPEQKAAIERSVLFIPHTNS